MGVGALLVLLGGLVGAFLAGLLNYRIQKRWAEEDAAKWEARERGRQERWDAQ